MKTELKHLLDEVKSGGNQIHYRKVSNIPVHVLIGDGVTHIFVKFSFENDYNFPLLTCKGITSKIDKNTFTLISSNSDSDLLISLVADLLKPIEKSVFKGQDESKYVGWLRKQLIRWVSYYRSTSDEVMSREKQLGIFGELTTLLSYLRGGSPLSCWRGPYGDYHDFQNSHHHREVKSRLTTSKEVVTINGAEQLHYNGTLFLSILHCIEHENGESIYDLIDQITPFLTWNELQEFYHLLSYLGTLPVEEKSSRFKLVVEENYQINNGFPRQPIIEGTVEVSYKLQLNTIKKFLINKVDYKVV